MVQLAMEANEKYKLNTLVIDATFIKPIDEELLLKLKNNYSILTIEDNVLSGGLGNNITMFLIKNNFKNNIITMGYDDKFIEQGSINELFEQEGLTIEKIKENVDKLKRN